MTVRTVRSKCKLWKALARALFAAAIGTFMFISIQDGISSALLAGRAEHQLSRSVFLGDQYGGWTIRVPDTPLNGTIVYTIGVGRNIEWDKEMISTFSTVHHGWDPTPSSLDFFSKQPPPNGFYFHQYGLGVADGNVTVKLPEGNKDSFTIMEHGEPAQAGTVIDIPVLTLPSMMKMLGHQFLSILKIDIEGAEFAVIDKWAREKYRIPADQVLVEFHERYFTNAKANSLVPEAVKKMASLGFKQFHRAKLVSNLPFPS